MAALEQVDMKTGNSAHEVIKNIETCSGSASSQSQVCPSGRSETIL